METRRLALSPELTVPIIQNANGTPLTGVEQRYAAGSDEPEHNGDQQPEGSSQCQKVQTKGHAHSNLLRRKQEKITFH